jgi:hypothetical protein
VRWSLFSVAGEEVYRSSFEAVTGENQVTWELQNLEGVPVASGLDIHAVQVQSQSAKTVLLGKIVVIH